MNQKLELDLHKNELSMDAHGRVSSTMTLLGTHLHKLKLMWGMSEAEVVEKLAFDAVRKAEQRYLSTDSFCKPIKTSSLTQNPNQ